MDDPFLLRARGPGSEPELLRNLARPGGWDLDSLDSFARDVMTRVRVYLIHYAFVSWLGYAMLTGPLAGRSKVRARVCGRGGVELEHERRASKHSWRRACGVVSRAKTFPASIIWCTQGGERESLPGARLTKMTWSNVTIEVPRHPPAKTFSATIPKNENNHQPKIGNGKL